MVKTREKLKIYALKIFEYYYKKIKINIELGTEFI